jgi:hypothetical protein
MHLEKQDLVLLLLSEWYQKMRYKDVPSNGPITRDKASKTVLKLKLGILKPQVAGCTDLN